MLKTDVKRGYRQRTDTAYMIPKLPTFARKLTIRTSLAPCQSMPAKGFVGILCKRLKGHFPYGFIKLLIVAMVLQGKFTGDLLKHHFVFRQALDLFT